MIIFIMLKIFIIGNKIQISSKIQVYYQNCIILLKNKKNLCTFPKRKTTPG